MDSGTVYYLVGYQIMEEPLWLIQQKGKALLKFANTCKENMLTLVMKIQTAD